MVVTTCRISADRRTQHPPVMRSMPRSIIIIIVIDEAVFILSILKLVIQCGDLFLLVFFHPFFQAFKGRFTRLLFVSLNVLEGYRGELFLGLCVIIDSWDIGRMVI